MQYTDLANVPAFDYESLRQEHVKRDRENELSRSADAQRNGKKGKVAPRELDDEEFDSDEEEEEFKASVLDKARRQDDESGSYDGDNDMSKVLPREKSGRKGKKRDLDDYECFSADAESPQMAGEDDVESQPPQPKKRAAVAATPLKKAPARKTDGKMAAKKKPRAAALSAASPVVPSPTAVVGKAKPPREAKKRAVPDSAVRKKSEKRAVEKASASAAPATLSKPAPAPAPTVNNGRKRVPKKAEAVAFAAPSAPAPSVPVSVPARKRVKFAGSGAAAAAEPAVAGSAARPMDADSAAALQVAEEIEAEEAEAVPVSNGDEYIRKFLETPLACVSNHIIDDYLQLLRQSCGGRWPDGMLVEKSAHWALFELDKGRPEALLKTFIAKDRLKGVNRIVWPISGRFHFAVLIISVKEQKIELLDSIVACRKNWKLGVLHRLLRSAFGWKRNAKVTYPACREQGNSVDCGVYAMANVRNLVEGVSVTHPRMPGAHMGKKKEEAVRLLRAHFAAELRSQTISLWK